MQLANLMYENSDNPDPFPQGIIDQYKNDPSLPNTNWMDLVFNNGQIQQHNISIMSGVNKTKFAFTGSYLHQLGNVKGFDYDRYNFRLNLDNQVTKAISIGVNVAGMRGINNGPAGSIFDVYFNHKCNKKHRLINLQAGLAQLISLRAEYRNKGYTVL